MVIKILSNDELFWLYLNNREKLNSIQFSKLYFNYLTKNSIIDAMFRGEVEFSQLCKNEILNDSWKTQCYKLVDYMDKRNIRVLLYSSENYPKQLKDIDSPPPILYYIGDITLCDSDCVAIVGSRVSSSYGRKCTESFAEAFAQHNICVVSGMAEGIDSFAQWSALNNGGSTIAVLGSGIDFIYPTSNTALYNEICSKGLVLSEFPISTEPDKNNFPYRNRLIVGLARCLVVTEAGMPSGTMSTVDFALDQGKEVFAIPGSINSPTSAGTNYLIKNGCPCAIDPYDIMTVFGKFKVDKSDDPIPDDEDLDETQKDILKILYVEDLSFEQIEDALNIDADQLNMALTMLEICGYVEQDAGRLYSLKIKAEF